MSIYLKEVVKSKSILQNIDDICFKKKGLLYFEFSNLFRSLFDHSEHHLNIVRTIVKLNNSASRESLIAHTKISSGGAINRKLDELEASSFIKGYVPYGKKRKDKIFSVVDEYTLFYLKWIEPYIEKGMTSGNYRQKLNKTSLSLVWSGFAFENICFKHLDQIATALGLNIISYVAGKWRFVPTKKSHEQGAQIDLLFDRDDGVITLCEIKYFDKRFVIDKAYAKSLDRKIDVFEKHFASKQKHLAMISTFGIRKNMYFEDLVHNEVILDDLFEQ